MRQETLQQSTQIHTQRLIAPLKLQVAKPPLILPPPPSPHLIELTPATARTARPPTAHRPPRPQLTAADELIVIDHLNIFKQNGFEIQVDSAAPPTQRLRLLALPFSKHTVFGPR